MKSSRVISRVDSEQKSYSGLLGFWTSSIVRYSEEHASEIGSVCVLR
jgi:hypothetical protein